MNIVIFATVGGLTLVGLIMLAIGIGSAPEAFEDEKGFHTGPDEDATRQQSSAGDQTPDDFDKVTPA